MVKTSFLLIFLITGEAISNKSCKSKNNVIIWSDSQKLKWKDFKGKKDITSENAVVSSVQLKIKYELNTIIVKIDVKCLFFCTKSWFKDTSVYLLRHEQGHFDIGEIVARRLRAKLIETNSVKNILTVSKIDSIFFSYVAILKKEQELYDEDTRHSMDSAMQIFWDQRIKMNLDSLERYVSSELY